jgi:hypothetical protein
MSKFIYFLLLTGLVSVFSCSKDDNTTPANCTSTPTYKTDIAAIMNASCAQAGCHSSSSRAGGYELSTYSGTKNAAGKSDFLKSIKHSSGVQAMPQGGSKLPDATITKIECWISNGTPE